MTEIRQIAALYVAAGGTYFGLEGVDPWDEKRDARAYPGPNPVVAHPPCKRWGRYWYGGPSCKNRATYTLIASTVLAGTLWGLRFAGLLGQSPL